MGRIKEMNLRELVKDLHLEFLVVVSLCVGETPLAVGVIFQMLVKV